MSDLADLASNRFHSNSMYPAPEVGMGATRQGWSDRHAFTIIKVHSPKKITVQRDQAIRVDQNGMSESQTYTYAPDPNGTTRVVTLRANGRWVEQGESTKGGPVYAIGVRSEYFDFSF